MILSTILWLLTSQGPTTDIPLDDTGDSCVVLYLVDGTHACNGSYVVSDGDQCRPGQVFLADAVSLLFAHHVTKTVKKRQLLLNIWIWLRAWLSNITREGVLLCWGEEVLLKMWRQSEVDTGSTFWSLQSASRCSCQLHLLACRVSMQHQIKCEYVIRTLLRWNDTLSQKSQCC